MTHVDTQWAMQSVLQLSHHLLRAHATAPMASTTTSAQAIRVTSMPRIMQTMDGSRLLLLARRPSGIAGVELGYGGRLPWKPTSVDAPGVKHAKKTRLLAAYLHRRGFATTPTPASSSLFPVPRAPLLLHTNHFLGWKLSKGATAAFPLYAHTLVELQQLRGKEVTTLHPRDCLVATSYSEWDNWREVMREPGWEFFGAGDDTVERLLREGVTAPLVAEEDGVCKVEVS